MKKIAYRLTNWLSRNLLCRFGQHVPPPVILPGLRWVNCTRCGTPLN